MKRSLEIESCFQCPHLEYLPQEARKDGGWNCKKLMDKVKPDRGGRHVSNYVYQFFRVDLEKYEESQHGMFPRVDRPHDPFVKLWVDNCPLPKL